MRNRAGAAGLLAMAVVLALFLAGGAVRARSAAPPKRVLLLTHNIFYNHDNLEDIETALPEWGRAGGFSVTSLQGYKQTAACTREQPCAPGVVDLSMIDAEYLAQFDAIVMSTNGELPFTDRGRRALVGFVRGGKGIVFLHQSMVTLYGFKPWGEMLGAYASLLPSFDVTNARKHPAVLKIEERSHPAVRHLPQHWTLDDEFAQFSRKAWDPGTPGENIGPTRLPVPLAFSRDRVRVVLSVDTTRTDFNGAPPSWNAKGDYPVAWYQHYGRGRTFYTSLGHRRDLWTSDAAFRGSGHKGWSILPAWRARVACTVAGLHHF